MTHAELQESLAVYRDLRGPEREELDRHVAGCAECSAILDAYRAMDWTLSGLRDARPDARLRQGYYAALGPSRRQTNRQGNRRFRGGLVGSAFALLVVIGCYLWLIQPAGPGRILHLAVVHSATPEAPDNSTVGVPALAPNPALLVGSSWVLVSMDGNVPVDGSEISLHFDDGMITGSGGCTEYTGRYNVNNGRINITYIEWLRQLCAKPLAVRQQEDTYTTLLGQAVRYRLNTERLEMVTAGGKLLAFVHGRASTATPTFAPQLTATSPRATDPALPTGCTATGMDTALLASPEDGFCLLYPARMKPGFSNDPGRETAQRLATIRGTDPVVLSIISAPANGLSLEQVARNVLSGWSAEIVAQVQRSEARLGGEQAIILDHMPGQPANRQAFVIHGDRLYQLVLSPFADPAFAQSYAEAQALWDTVAGSFAFTAPQSSDATPTPNPLIVGTQTPQGLGNWEGAQVTLDIFSGRPNPSWSLSAAQAQELRRVVDALPEVACRPPDQSLGYRGFVVVLGQRPELSNEYRLRSFAGQVRWGDPWDPQAPATCRGDVDRQVERFLLGSGKGQLSSDIYALAEANIQPRPPRCDVLCQDATASVPLTLTPLATITQSPSFRATEDAYNQRRQVRETRQAQITLTPASQDTATPPPASLWESYQAALLQAILPPVSPEGVCEWAELGRGSHELYIWAYCTGYLPGGIRTAASLPVVLALSDDGRILSMRVPGDGSLYEPDVRSLFPVDVQALILGGRLYSTTIPALEKHALQRLTSPQLPPSAAGESHASGPVPTFAPLPAATSGSRGTHTTIPTGE
jgi:heat shock protein HslJ